MRIANRALIKVCIERTPNPKGDAGAGPSLLRGMEITRGKHYPAHNLRPVPALPFTCHLGATANALHVLRPIYMPSNALYVVATLQLHCMTGSNPTLLVADLSSKPMPIAHSFLAPNLAPLVVPGLL
jgi:hypothetical protein